MDIDREADEDRGRDHRDYRVRSDTPPPRSRSLSPGRRPQPARAPSPRFLRHLEELGQSMDVDWTPTPAPEPAAAYYYYSPKMEVEMRPDMAPGWMVVTSPLGRHHQNRRRDVAESRRRRPSPRQRIAQRCWSRPTLRWSPGRAGGGSQATSTQEGASLQGEQEAATPEVELSAADEDEKKTDGEAGERVDEPAATTLDLAATIPIGGFDFDLIPGEALPRGTKRERAMVDGGDEEHLERQQKRRACGHWKLSGGADSDTDRIASAAGDQGCGPWKSPSTTDGGDTSHTDSVVEGQARQGEASASGHWKSPSTDGDDTSHTALPVEDPEGQARQEEASVSGHWKSSSTDGDDTSSTVPSVDDPEGQARQEETSKSGHWKSPSTDGDDTSHSALPVEDPEAQAGSQAGGPWKLLGGADNDTDRAAPAGETGAAVDTMSDDSTVVGEDEADDVEWTNVDCFAPGPRGVKRKRPLADDGYEGLAERREGEEEEEWEEEGGFEETASDISGLIQTSPAAAAAALVADPSDVAHDHDHDQEQDTALLAHEAYYYDQEYATNMLRSLLDCSLPALLVDIKHPEGTQDGAAREHAYRVAQRFVDGTGLREQCHWQLRESWTEFYEFALEMGQGTSSSSPEDDGSDEDEDGEGDEAELGPYEMALVFDAIWERQIRPFVGPREDFGWLDQALTSAQQRRLRARLRQAREEYMNAHEGIEEDAYDGV